MPFAFYDLETSGTNPAYDQPLQFAAILTDDRLEPLDEFNIRCRLSPHVLPAPWALAVTGTTPADLSDPGLPTFFEFTGAIAELITRWARRGPCTWTGYNSISFDEEMLRHAFYQNLHPSPYRTQFDGNDRMDVMTLVYSVWVLANGALNWATDEGGRNSFKLGSLAEANGFRHDIHDALGDVGATIDIARAIRDEAPDVWNRSLRNRSKKSVNEMLHSGRPLRLIERIGAAPPHSVIGAFAGRNPNNRNAIAFLDLELCDPADLAAVGDEEISDALESNPRKLLTVAANRFPSLFELEAVEPVVADRAERLANMKRLRDRIGAAMANRFADRAESPHVEERLYSQFYSEGDRILLESFQQSSWQERLGMLDRLDDPRLRKLGLRLVYLYRPDLLDPDLARKSSAAMRNRWHAAADDAGWITFAEADRQLEEIESSGAMNAADIGRMRAFYDERRRVE